jgi:Tol biopolymer transport system component
MFTTLYFKEWKEKALLLFFELGILAVLIIAAQSVFREKKDIREWLIYAVLMLFYPFAALILGAAGFDAEYRKGAWAYLFSRPIRKAEIWLAKFAALLSMLAALWLIFVALWAAVPGLREIRAWPMLGKVGLTLESEFPWWSILLSAFLLTVAFSLSLLHERQFNILFLALIVGFFLPAAAWAVMNTKAGGFLAWLSPERALSTFLIFHALVALAFAAASVLTLVRSDFSQPRKLTFGFVRWFAPFLVLALAATAASATLMPVIRERYLYLFTSSAGDACYVTERGVFKYSASKHRIEWVVKGKQIDYWGASASGGKIVYSGYDIRSKDDWAEELWVANADGSGRKKIIGGGPREKELTWEDSIGSLLISPDGAKIAILSRSIYSKPWGKRRPPLRIAYTDGTRLESLPDDPALFETPADRRFYFYLVAWAADGNAVLISKIGYGRPSAVSLWLYDLGSRTARKVLDNAAVASWRMPSPRGNLLLAIKYQKSPEAPWRLAVLDLKTMATTDVSGGTADDQSQISSQVSWDPEGNRMAYLCRRKQAGGPDAYFLAVYSLAQQKTITERVMTKSESSARLYSPSWTADGAKIVVIDREANGLRILGPDLGEIVRIAFPHRLATPADLQVVGDQALVGDNDTDSLWRCDLVKKTWKRLY